MKIGWSNDDLRCEETMEAPGTFAGEAENPLSLVVVLKFACTLQSHENYKILVLILSPYPK